MVRLGPGWDSVSGGEDMRWRLGAHLPPARHCLLVQSRSLLRAMVCDLCAKRDARDVSPLACPSGAPLRGSEQDHGNPCTAQAKVDKEGQVRVCGFEPAKALVRGLPLPLPLSFRDRLGYQLQVLSPIEGVGQTTKWPATAGARPQIDWLRCG
ncbi:hypothetical protein HD554DRAFT_1505362 [Boletus coccyginus]|nr:hypothetical protein HD554DRAFT_1505362 [Boletus coccyginus]